jgi:hypothetical protein
LQDTLAELCQDASWVTDLHDIDDNDRRNKSDFNGRIASRAFKKVLAARIVAFELFLEAVIKVNKKLEEKHKHYWLLFQLFNPQADIIDKHPIVQIMKNCLHQASTDALNKLIKHFYLIHTRYMPHTHFIVGVDEAQQAVRLYCHSFVSSTNDKAFRSIICEIAKVFTTLPIKLVVSGTCTTKDDLHDLRASGVSKHDPVELYHDLGMFDTWSKLRLFLECYLPAAFLETDSWHHMQSCIQEYLLGR